MHYYFENLAQEFGMAVVAIFFAVWAASVIVFMLVWECLDGIWIHRRGILRAFQNLSRSCLRRSRRSASNQLTDDSTLVTSADPAPGQVGDQSPDLNKGPSTPMVNTEGPPFASDDLPDPFLQAGQLIAGAWRLLPHCSICIPTEAWSVGLALHPGPVCDRNEDYAMALQIDDVTVAILADGCGGIPYGQEAAYIGVMGAAASIIRHLAWRTKAHSDGDLLTVAQTAVDEASRALIHQAGRLGIDPTSSMRSTLIVTLTTPNHLYYAYIGDGGGWVLHTDDGSLDAFVIPQKVDSRPNLLAASLGATIQGEPQNGQLDRRRGDLIWICSDGIADRTDPMPLGCELAQALVMNGGDMTGVAESFLSQFAAWTDETGIVFDDNMSLVLVADQAVACPPARANYHCDASSLTSETASASQPVM